MQIKLQLEKNGRQNMNLEVETMPLCTLDRWLKRDARLTMANHSRLFFLHAPHSYQITVPRQIYFHTATLAVPFLLSVFSPKKQFSSFSFLLFSWSNLVPQPSIPSFSFSPTISPFICLLSLSHQGLRWEQRGDRRASAWPCCLPF